MKVINFFGGPGCGKSTAAAGLFHKMKNLNYSVELVTEYAKELVWEGAIGSLTDQLHLLAVQNKRLERLRGRVDFAITDSPLLLGGYYGKLYGDHPRIVVPLCKNIFDTYDNINFFIERTKPYVKLGRLGDESQAIQADKAIWELMEAENCQYVVGGSVILEVCMAIIESNYV